jgi:bacteriorhodopsin
VQLLALAAQVAVVLGCLARHLVRSTQMWSLHTVVCCAVVVAVTITAVLSATSMQYSARCSGSVNSTNNTEQSANTCAVVYQHCVN